jgi:hypothetical protein
MMICLLGTKAREPFQFKIAIAIDLTIEITQCWSWCLDYLLGRSIPNFIEIVHLGLYFFFELG